MSNKAGVAPVGACCVSSWDSAGTIFGLSGVMDWSGAMHVLRRTWKIGGIPVLWDWYASCHVQGVDVRGPSGRTRCV